jgi:quinoprotein glucose dehydrogenase
VRIGPLFTPPSIQGTLVRPGLDGGTDWGGGAFDPDTGVLYVKVNDDPALVFPDITDAQGNVPAVGPNDSTNISLLLRHRIPILKPPYAYVNALDLNKGRMLWQKPFGDNPAVRAHPALADVKLPPQLGAIGNGGLLVTAGGLLFAGSGDRALHAIDKVTGEDLWTYPIGSLRCNGSPMTYRVAGRQFVVIAVGGPGEGARLLAFALPVPGAAALPQPVFQSDRGHLQVQRICGECHAFEVATRTRHNRKQWEALIESMIARGARVSDEDFDVIADYLSTHFGVDGSTGSQD